MTINMAEDLRSGVEELLEIKKKSGERKNGIQIHVIRNFITDEIVKQKAYVESILDDRKSGWQELNDIFLKSL